MGCTYVHIAHEGGGAGAARSVCDEQHYSGQRTSEQLEDYLTVRDDIHCGEQITKHIFHVCMIILPACAPSECLYLAWRVNEYVIKVMRSTLQYIHLQ